MFEPSWQSSLSAIRELDGFRNCTYDLNQRIEKSPGI